MKGLATILRHSKIHQIKGNLIRYDINGKLVGKCALGVISCKVGLKLDKNNTDIPAMDILRASGITEKDIGSTYPFIRQKNCYAKLPDQPAIYDESYSTLEEIIFHLNDGIGFSFKEIADFLETTFPEKEWAK